MQSESRTRRHPQVKLSVGSRAPGRRTADHPPDEFSLAELTSSDSPQRVCRLILINIQDNAVQLQEHDSHQPGKSLVPILKSLCLRDAIGQPRRLAYQGWEQILIVEGLEWRGHGAIKFASVDQGPRVDSCPVQRDALFQGDADGHSANRASVRLHRLLATSARFSTSSRSAS